MSCVADIEKQYVAVGKKQKLDPVLSIDRE